ncbi:hypothetical protein ACIHCQ_27805 [Streptomyces sp. NPDC052236]|uniref:hypothetical protein n=1 Tax=Streptomyces sp. NPDC052236 TaxID=3365686 RepID=UPI0037D53989
MPEPDRLPEFTRETLPRNFRTWQQISDAGLEPVGPPVGLLVWTPRNAYSSKNAKVYDASRARVPGPRDPDIFDLCEEFDGLDQEILVLAQWSQWAPLAKAEVPRMPGVYLARRGPVGPLVYVGRAGERKGEGLHGRLRRYTSGKALASGLGEAVFDRALADPEWLRERLVEVECGRPMRATEWGKADLAWADVHVCWVVTESGKAAEALEKKVLALESVDWWNRAR